MSTKDQQDIQHNKISADGQPTIEQRLQTRFEEAMQRRQERMAQKAPPSLESEPTDEILIRDESKSPSQMQTEIETSEANKSTLNNNDGDGNAEIEAEPSDADGAIKNDKRKNAKDATTSKDPTAVIKEREKVKSKTSRRLEQNSGAVDENEFVEEKNARRPPKKNVAKSTTRNVQRDEMYEQQQTFDNHYDDKYYDYEDRYSSDDPANVDYDDDYNDFDDQGYHSSRFTPTCEWETYRSTSIVFPPLTPQTSTRDDGSPTTTATRPKAIIHFVGGTFFGSYPRKFYGSLLEDIARKCDAVVVATPIPLVLPGKGLVNKLENWMFDEGGSRRSGRESANPLDHLSMAESIQKEFNNVYRDVILDEYCYGYMDNDKVEDFMKTVPIVGIGHSLGARIQAISCAHPRISKRCLAMGKGNQLIRSGREGMIYLGFANWGASTSIPGLETLDRTVKKRNQGRREKEEGRRGVGRRDDVWDERSPRRRRQSGYGDDMRRRYNRYDRHEAEDLDLADVFSDVVLSVAKGAKQIGEALTPEEEDLEFTPTPNALWDDLSSADGSYSQSCLNTLIVQFNQDPIDQGSRLARTLLNAYDAESNSTVADGKDSNRIEPLHDVKFARLSGGHLTPVTLQDGIAKFLPRGAVSLFSSSYNFVLKQLDDERIGKSRQKQQREANDVADTVASYIKSISSDG